jgi:hypothetical protein
LVLPARANLSTSINSSPPLTTHSVLHSLWRWNWQMVPKRRQIKIWRRGNTQKNKYNTKFEVKLLFGKSLRFKVLGKTFLTWLNHVSNKRDYYGINSLISTLTCQITERKTPRVCYSSRPNGN